MASSQPIYCMACGHAYRTNFNLFQGQVCSWRCWDELKWREALSISCQEYYPIPESAQLNKANYDREVIPAHTELP